MSYCRHMDILPLLYSCPNRKNAFAKDRLEEACFRAVPLIRKLQRGEDYANR